ncbi:transglutaminaseTgpA domain-containing protein [Lentzea sp. NPDC051838]|uniref:transglutaminase TgpA family protein n=1 Tax=Lentzea sp. NPDC051838 TaxID=3154849 RepID=UPI003437570B
MNWRKLVPGGALAEVVLTLMACAAGPLVYHRFFTTGYLPVLALALVAGGLSAALGHRRVWTTLALGVLGLATVMVYGVFDGVASAVLGGVRGSWNRLLTVTAPADTWGELLAAPALVVWAAAFSSVLLVLLTRSALAPLLPPLAGFVFALFVAGNQAGSHQVATIVFLVSALVLIALRTHRGHTRGTVRVERQSTSPVAALVVVGSVVAASALFGVAGGQFSSLASGEHRFDPRDVLAPPIVRTDTLTPLSQLKKQLNESPPRTLFTVRTDSESTRIDRVRTAALDTFDGTTWTSSDTYRVAGGSLTTDPELQHSKPVSAHIELKELTGPYLPVVGWPSKLAATGESRGRFGFNPDSGVVVSNGPTSRGLSYDVTGEVGVRDKGLSWATPLENNLPPLPGGVPEALDNASKWFDGAHFDRLVQLETFLRAKSYQLNRPPGHSYATIARLLSAEDATNGYSEQNAAAFTVIARMWGLPARVAVGYRLRHYQGGVFQVTTADAHAWSEVHFSGYGWVVFDPTNPDDTSKRNPPPEAPLVVPPQPAPPTAAPQAAPPAASQPADAADEQGFSWDNVLNGNVVLAPAAALLGAFATGFVVLFKVHRRRRRRHAADHAAQVLGAWHEQLDRLAERGISPSVSLTFLEVAEHVRAVLGEVANPVEETAELATTAIYAPGHLDRAASVRAWELVAQLKSGLYPGRVSAARLLAAFDPRPLWTTWSVARQRRQAGESLETGRYR